MVLLGPPPELTIDDDEMAALDSSGGGFKICPQLQAVELQCPPQHSAVDSMVGFVTSRWRPPGTIKEVSLRGASFWFTGKSDLSKLSGPWEPLAKCIEEGLWFAASNGPTATYA